MSDHISGVERMPGSDHVTIDVDKPVAHTEEFSAFLRALDIEPNNVYQVLVGKTSIIAFQYHDDPDIGKHVRHRCPALGYAEAHENGVTLLLGESEQEVCRIAPELRTIPEHVANPYADQDYVDSITGPLPKVPEDKPE